MNASIFLAGFVLLPCLCPAASAAQEPKGQVARAAAEQEAWVQLFDGETLAGWTQRNGTATYRVEDGTVVGKTTDGSPNSFLCSNRDYSDFELRFETKVHGSLNSGVQIRSSTRGSFTGRVNGPQVEIEAGGAKGAEAGYLYAEAAGGWMTPDKLRVPHKTFRDGEWNHYRVLAEGPRIRVWLNGVQVTDLSHKGMYASHPRGFIGLQVHSIGRGQGPFEVRWRDIRIREVRSKEAGWKRLYNGKDLSGWETTGNWLPEKDGVLAIRPRQGELGWQRFGAYLWTREPCADFILDLQYSYPKGGNSGVFVRVGDRANPVNTGIEVQILDCWGKPDDKMTAHDHAGIIGTSAPKSNASKLPGEWNHMILCMRGGHLEVDLNGTRVIDLELSKTGLKGRPARGYIGLQDHGAPNELRFRHILLKEL